MRAYIIEAPPEFFDEGARNKYAATTSDLRREVAEIRQRKGSHWVYLNIEVREVNIPTDKASVIQMLNTGITEDKLVREWETTPRGSVRVKRTTT